tara:strand:- start:2109 stop:2747 length:639 start_codon:yes stop_codon:yes gene_type:complete
MTPKFDRLVEDMDASPKDVGQQQPPAKVAVAQHPDNVLMNTFYRYLMDQENAGMTGYNPKTKMWFPHNSVEGGTKTLGYGHKFPTDAIQKKWYKDHPKGISTPEVLKLLQDDVTVHALRAKANVDKMTKDGTWMKLPVDSKLMLLDIEYTPGLSKFPKFVKAVTTGNWTGNKLSADKHYKRYTKGRELTRRNNAFFNLFLRNKISVKKTRNP